MSDSIYLDNQATTPTDPRVLAAMSPFLEVDRPGNPHSDHVVGRKAAGDVERARAEIAALIGAQPHEIIFTSGATEANNLAIQGLARSPHKRGRHLVTVATEHKCVLETAAFLERTGFSVTVLPVQKSGLVDLNGLADAISEDTFLVSVMAANNEIGTLQPLEQIAELCRSRGAIFHSDAAQAAGNVALDVKAIGLDMMSLSGHKLYAPIGIGALYVSDYMAPALEPLILGGGQERGLRSGTLPPHLCVGFGAACAIATAEMTQDAELSVRLRELFLSIVSAAIPNVRVNGDPTLRLPGSLNLTLPGVDADRLVGGLQPDVALSTNAACNSGVLMPSYVLRALGLSEGDAASTIRLGFGRFNNAQEVESAAHRLLAVASRIHQSENLGTAAE
jgi:cysteine desulfurase